MSLNFFCLFRIIEDFIGPGVGKVTLSLNVGKKILSMLTTVIQKTCFKASAEGIRGMGPGVTSHVLKIY